MEIHSRGHLTPLQLLYMFMLIIFSGSATLFARSLGDIRTFGNALMLLLTIALIFEQRITFGKNYFLTIGIFSLFAVITSIRNHLVNPLWWSQWLIWLTIAYCTCRGLREKLFVTYEKIIAILCLISIPLWLITVLSPSLAYSIVHLFEFSSPFSSDSDVDSNMLVYTLPRIGFNDTDFRLLTRNSGFAWEPGAFASHICLALFCNIVRTDFRILSNISLWVLLITLLTTQSTTGYMIFIFIVFFFLLLKKKFLPILVVVPLLVLLFQLPFVKDKMMDEYANMLDFDLNRLSSQNGIALGRMVSFMLDFEEFKSHPLIGLGGYSEGTILFKDGYENVGTISGIGTLLSKFGAIMSLLFIYLLIKSSHLISRLYKRSTGYLLIPVIVGTMVSYDLWTQPLFISFWMCGLYYPSRLSESKQILSPFLTK